MDVAPSITWLLVTTSPVEVSPMPVPAASSCWYPSVVSISTSPGSTFFAMAETSLGPLPPDEPEPPDVPEPPNAPEPPDGAEPPNVPEPPDGAVELEAGAAELDGALFVQAT